MDFDPRDVLGYSVALALALLAIGFLSQLAYALLRAVKKAPDAPSMGPSLPILSYWGAVKFLMNAPNVLREGYNKYKGGIFRIAQLNRWMYIVTSPQLVEDLRKAPESALSSIAALNELLHTQYTIRANFDEFLSNFRHLLLRRYSSPELADETITALGEMLPVNEDWQAVPIYDIIEEVLYRASNRLFIGQTLCRNADYINLNKAFTSAVLRGALIFHSLPGFLRPIVSWFVDPIKPIVAHASEFLEPEFQERAQSIAQFGQGWPGIEDDLLSGLMAKYDKAIENKRDLTLQILTLTLAAVHTTSQSVMHALYFLATNPAYVETLREEVDGVVSSQGWGREGIPKMRKLDSFLRESLRMRSLGALALAKMVEQDFTFSDGTTVLKGSIVAAPAHAVHLDNINYDQADTFQPWRFLSEEQDGSEEISGGHMTTTSSVFLAFGHGKHACPGRFFATLVLKLTMAYIINHYDVRVADVDQPPPPVWYVVACTPDPSIRVLLRKRSPVAA